MLTVDDPDPSGYKRTRFLPSPRILSVQSIFCLAASSAEKPHPIIVPTQKFLTF